MALTQRERQNHTKPQPIFMSQVSPKNMVKGGKCPGSPCSVSCQAVSWVICRFCNSNSWALNTSTGPCHSSDSLWHLTTETQGSTCHVCGEQSGTGTGFSPSTLVLPHQVSLHQCSVLIYHMWLVQYGHLSSQYLKIPLLNNNNNKKRSICFTDRVLVNSPKASLFCKARVLKYLHTSCHWLWLCYLHILTFL